MEERGKRGAAARVASPEKQEKTSPHGQADRLAEMYGVGHDTITKAGKFAAAVETLRAVDPDIEAKVVTGKGPTEGPQGGAKLRRPGAEGERLARTRIGRGDRPRPKSFRMSGAPAAIRTRDLQIRSLTLYPG